MKDRVPKYPGRTKITHADGTVEYVTIEKADEPLSGNEGTPLNKDNLLGDDAVEALALDKDATPNDAFRTVGNTLKEIQSQTGTIEEILSSHGASYQYSQENESVAAYINNVTYDSTDYTTSEIETYANQETSYDKGKPTGLAVSLKSGTLITTDDYTGIATKEEISAGTHTFNSLIPYRGDYIVLAADNRIIASGSLKPTGKLRMIDCPAAKNVRDLGGWACDGGTIRYGLLFRGGEVTAADRDVLVGQCGVRHDLNLRGSTEATWTTSPLGSDVQFTKADEYNWYTVDINEAWKINMRCIVDAVIHKEPVYFHCSAGADRTGTLACVIEGLLGMSESDINKDYEITSFAGDDYARKRNTSNWSALIQRIKARGENSFRDNCISFALELGITVAEINAFRQIMIDGTPDTIAPTNVYTIANNLTNVSTDNSSTQIDEYQPYEANITPAAGYIINSVSVLMGGKDITSSAWTGSETLFKYHVKYNLTNCTSNNMKKVATANESYTAVITPLDGYTLTDAAVTITMGGTNVANEYYKNGVISIPKVTGDIEITITAAESALPYVNQVPISTDGDGSIFNEIGYIRGKRLNSSHAVVTNDMGNTLYPVVTGFIPVKAGDVLRFKNAYILNYANGGYNSYFFQSDKTTVYGRSMTPTNLNNGALQKDGLTYELSDVDIDDHQGITKLVVTDESSIAYARFTLQCKTNAEVPIITVNEEIE